MNRAEFDGAKGRIAGFIDGILAAISPATVAPQVVDAPDGESRVVVLRDGYKVQPLTTGHRGKRTHQFQSIRSFGQWLRRYAQPEEVEILGDGNSITAALAPADPHGDLVSCTLEVHPRWRPWAALIGKQMRQRDLFLFVRSRPEDFATATNKNGTELGSYGPILAGELRKLEISKAAKFHTELGPNGEVSFSAGEDKTTISGKLPASFNLNLPIFRDVLLPGPGPEAEGSEATEHEPLYGIEVYLTMDHEDGEPLTFRLDVPNLDGIVSKAREDALACLRAELEKEPPSGFLVGLGRVGLATVPKRLPPLPPPQPGE